MMSEADVVTKRRGGRTARKELRAAPIPEAERPVKPGMEGGYYKPLTDREVERIHQAALSVLENIGFSEAIPSCIELFTDAGASMTDDGRLLISRAMVEDALAMAGRHFVLPGFDPKHDMEPWGTKVYFGTAGAAVHIVDLETRSYRESTLADLYDAARLVDAMDNIHFFQRSMVARDMEDPRDLDFNTCYACISGTAKHVGTSFVQPEHVDEALAMLHIIAGGEETGKLLTSHPAVRMVSFTGDTATGRKIMAQAAPTVKKLHLELGGKAPFVVFADADLEAAARGHGIAGVDRQVHQQLLDLSRVDAHGPTSGASEVAISTRSPIRRRSRRSTSDTSALSSTTRGCMTCRRLKASSCRVRPLACSEACRISAASSRRGSPSPSSW